MARRVNTRFLTILTIIVVVISVTALIAHLILGREKPGEFVAAGEQLLAEKKYEEAAKNFERAVQLSQNDPELWVKWGDALNEMSSIDLEYLARARRAWYGALAIDPRHKPALERTLQYQLAVADMTSGGPEFFKEMNETARRLLEADSGNAAAEAAVQTSIIRPWLQGVAEDPKRIAETIEAMSKLMEKYPDNPELPLYLAQAKLREAELARERRDVSEAGRKVAEAAKIVDDAVQRSQTAGMYFSAGQVAGLLAGYDSADKREQWSARRNEYFTKARQLVKPEDPQFTRIHVVTARAADPAEGEKILRELAAARPQDQEVRLALADVLKRIPDKHQEAIELLEKPFTRENLRGADAYKSRNLELQTLVLATDLRLDQLREMQEAQDRKTSLDTIQKNMELLTSRAGKENLAVLRLRGKLLRVQGKGVEAIQTLERARAVAEQLNVTSLERWEIVDMLARSYIEVRQTGNAKARLVELTEQLPGHDPSRILLANLLLQEGNVDEAARHVKVLAERRPDDPEIIRLQVQLADRRAPGGAPGTEKDEAELKANYARLPENNRIEAIRKLNMALTIDNKAESVRLVNKLQVENPGDVDIVMLAVNVHRRLNDVDAARAVVDNALKTRPDDQTLQLVKKQLADMNPQALAKLALEEAESKPPFERALIKANAYRQLNQPEEQLKHLQEAVKLKPNDGPANRVLFAYYLQHAQWDKAEAVLPTLAALDEDKAGGLLYRYQLAMGKRDYATALNHARNLVDRLPEFSHTWLALAQVRQAMAVDQQRQGEDATTEFNEALKNFNIALEKQSDNPDAMRGVIECLYNLNRVADARRKIDEARRVIPSSVFFEELQLSHELQFGDPAKVVAVRETQVKNASEIPQKVMALAQAYLRLAQSQASKGDGASTATFAKARDTLKQGMTKWPDAFDFYLAYAQLARASGELADTEKALQALVAREVWKDRAEPQLLLADFYSSTNRPAEVEAILRPLVTKFPSPEMKINLARFLASQKRHDEAMKVLEGSEDDRRVVELQVDILLGQGRLDEAAALLDKALTKTPDALPFLQLASIVHMRQGKLDLAGQKLDQALKIEPEDPITHYYAGQLASTPPNADLEKAIAHFAKGTASTSLGIESGFALAECHRRNGSYQAQVAALEDVLRKQPNSRRAKLVLVDAYMALSPPRNTDAMALVRDLKAATNGAASAEILAREAQLLVQDGKLKEALASINAAQAASPDNLQLKRQALDVLLAARGFAEVDRRAGELISQNKDLWWAYQARAVSKRQQGDREGAIRDFEAALIAADAQKDVVAAEGIVLLMGDVIGGNEAINRIQARAEKDDHWKIVVARLQQLGGDDASALRTLEEVLSRSNELAAEDRAAALRLAGMGYLRIDEPEKATQAYSRLLEVSTGDMTALNNLAYLLTESVKPPRPKEALKYSQQAYNLAMQQGMRDPLILDTHGWILASAGNVDEGIDVLRRSIEIRATPDAHYHLGESYLLKQFAPEAKRELEKALELINQAKKENQAVDAALEQRVVAAIDRATIMMNGQEPGRSAATRGADNAVAAPTASTNVR